MSEQRINVTRKALRAWLGLPAGVRLSIGLPAQKADRAYQLGLNAGDAVPRRAACLPSVIR